jgi:branched-chain amino acid transport system ATP-binding protein
MTAPLLQVRGLGKRFGGFTALDALDLDIAAGARIGVIGPNGAGKSTFVNLLAGTLPPDCGSILFGDTRVEKLPPHRRVRLGLARSFQLPQLFASMSVIENILVPLAYAAPSREASPFVRSRAEAQAMNLLEQIGLARLRHQPVGALTQVEMRKLELARAMAARPKLLLCDESMAGLSDSEVDDVLDLLFAINAEGVAVMMIEHIIKAVSRFSERVIVLVAGRKILEDAPANAFRHPEVERAYLGE